MPGLLAPLFLAGLAALAVPVFVHLIDKQQKKPVRFPSLMFLEEIPYRAMHRQRIQHWLLFLLRCLVIFLLVFAFARPFFKNDDALSAIGVHGGRDVVILLDRSYSMEYGDRWKRATSAAKDVVKGLGSSDRATVVYFAGTATMASPLTSEQSSLLKAIDTAQPTAGVTRYDAAFQLAKRILGDTAQSNREVVLISDYQRSGLGERELPRLPEGTTLRQIFLGGDNTENLIVSNGEIRYDTANGRERAIVGVRLTNRSTRAIAAHPVTLELNGREMQTKRVDVPANGATHVEFSGIIVPPGISRGLVRMTPDSLARDNMFHFVVAPRKPMSVVVVQPVNAEAQAGLFVANALRVGTPPAFNVTVTDIGKLSGMSLNDIELLILNGAPIPRGELGRRIVEYVKNGGGLFVALGDGSNPATWPDDSDALLPRPTTPPIDRLDDNGITLGYVDNGHAIFDVFNTSQSGGFSSMRVLRYWNITPGRDDRQLARFGDGRIALLERRVGLGRVLVWSSDLDGLWNDLPLQPIFLPLLRQTAHYASGSPREYRWMTVGSVLNPDILFGERTTPEIANTDQTTAIRHTQYVAVTPSGAQLRFDPLHAPELEEQGIYRITRSGSDDEASRLVAVNIDPTESDLAELDTALVRVAVAPIEATSIGASAKTSPLLGPEDREQRQRVWWYLLVAVLVLLGAETLMANRLSRSAH
jgi:hypothetical protein